MPEDVSLNEKDSNILALATKLLDEANSWEQIWGKLLVDGFEPQAIATTLTRLQQKKSLVQDTNPDSILASAITRQITLLSHAAVLDGRVGDSEIPAVVGSDLQARVSTANVTIFATLPEIANELLGLFHKLGLEKAQLAGITGNIRETIDAASTQLGFDNSMLLVCCTYGRDRTLAEMVNQISVTKGLPAIYYHAQGLQVQIGPLVIPKQTACFECFRVRRDASLAPWERFLLHTASDGGLLAATLGLDWVIVDAIKLLAGLGEPVSRGRVMFIDYYSGLPEIHSLLRIPRCSVCGTPSRPSVRLWDEHV